MVKALQTSLNHGKIFNKEIITGKNSANKFKP